MGGAREADTSLALEPAAPPGELPKAHTSELTRGPNAMPQTALRHPLRGLPEAAPPLPARFRKRWSRKLRRPRSVALPTSATGYCKDGALRLCPAAPAPPCPRFLALPVGGTDATGPPIPARDDRGAGTAPRRAPRCSRCRRCERCPS